jgi:hypothetical protein
MPELHSGMTQEYRAIHRAKILALGKRAEEFIAMALPDLIHIWVLSKLVSIGKTGAAINDLRAGIDSSKGDVVQVLDKLAKLGLVRSSGLISKKYTFCREEQWSDVAIKLVKLWKHPQGHASVLEAIKNCVAKGQEKHTRDPKA